jgi:hypothetical protein
MHNPLLHRMAYGHAVSSPLATLGDVIQRHRNTHGRFFHLIILVLMAVGLVACPSESVPTTASEPMASSFQLYLLPEVEAKRLSHRAAQSEYQSWLEEADLRKALLVLKREDISSVEGSQSGSLSITLTISTSRKVVAILEPKLDVDRVLSGEYSLGCLEAEKAFLITVQDKRAVGGTLRCPTALIYTHPEIYPVSRDGAVMLTIRQIDASIRDTLIAVLQ